MVNLEKQRGFKIVSVVIAVSFIFQNFLYSQPILKSNLRIPIGNSVRIEERLKRENPDPSHVSTSTLSREAFLDRILEMVSRYLSEQYNLPVYTGLSPQQTEKLFKEYTLSSSVNNPLLIIKAIQLIMENNMRFNHMYIGHMLTTPAALPVFINYIIDFINSNQADPSTNEIYQLIERQTIQWLARIIGYGEERALGLEVSPGGIITSGGTTANMLALKLMRDIAINKALKEAGRSEDIRSIGLQRALEILGNKEAVLFVSQEAHYSWEKMGGYEGIGAVNVIGVNVDFSLRMDTRDLKEKIEQAREKGKIIIGVMATAGTTETGNIDPVKEIYKIAKENGNNIWLHIDGAYGAACALAREEELEDKMSCINMADSVTIDPHKFLYMPYNLGALIVKDSRSLGIFRPYFQRENEGVLAQSFIADRRFDALKLWAALQWMGTDEFGKIIDYVNEMTQYLYIRLKQDKAIEVLSVREMDLFTFRYIPPELKHQLETAVHRGDKETINQINAKINKLTELIQGALQDSGKGWVSVAEMKNSRYSQYASSSADASYEINALRVAAMNPFINKTSVEAFYNIIKNISQKTAFEHSQELGLGDIIFEPMLEQQIPETSVTKTFQKFFFHPETSGKLADIGKRIVDLTLGKDGGGNITSEDISDFKKDLSDFTVPRLPGNETELLKKLAVIVHIARQQNEKKNIPEAAMAASMVYPALNPNQIAWAVSPSSTYAEAQAIKWLADLFDYRGYTAHLGGVSETVVPGGIVTNSATMASLTALLVARNVLAERLLRSYNEQQQPSSKVDITKAGFPKVIEIVRQYVTKNNKSRFVIIASESKHKIMQELAIFAGMGQEDVISVQEDRNGTVNGMKLKKTVAEQKQKGNIVMMIAVNLGSISHSEAPFLKKIFRDKMGDGGMWIHAFVDKNYRSSFGVYNSPMEAVIRNTSSLTVDMQSLLNMPYGLGVALFQNESILKQYLKQSAPYVIREKEAGTRLDLSGYSPEGSKGFQALELFLAILLYGRQLKEAISKGDIGALDTQIFGADVDNGITDRLKTTPSAYNSSMLRKPLLENSPNDIERSTKLYKGLLDRERSNLELDYREKLKQLEDLFTDALKPLEEGEFSIGRIKTSLTLIEDDAYELIKGVRDDFIKLQLFENKDNAILLYTLLTWRDAYDTGICRYINNCLRKAFVSINIDVLEIDTPVRSHTYIVVSKNRTRIAIDAASNMFFNPPKPEIVVEEYESYKEKIEREVVSTFSLLRGGQEERSEAYQAARSKSLTYILISAGVLNKSL